LEKGWENPAGDTYFKKQRKNADKTDNETSRYHFKLMMRIAEELHNATLGFATKMWPGSVLDMCVAPGGFLATATNLNTGCEALGFSLPPSDGGYNVLLGGKYKDCVKFLDITMLAEDMGVIDIPAEHPDAGNFLPRQIEETRLFDLVICDGHVLRTHAPTRASYRETREGDRLKTTQLALGLEHLTPGGTMIILLHKLEAWDTVCYFQRFKKFSSTYLYKPTSGHATRSSFYMVARYVRRNDPEAILAIEKWKAVWRAATFGTDEEYEQAIRKGEQSAEELLEEFGSVLAEGGRVVWETQAKALAKAPFIKMQ
jgi:23S rRNA U2552 (ribose-2'-O)-methylase RlmE/FtsJ